MKTFISNITNVFAELIKNPDAAGDCAVRLQDLLNAAFGDEQKTMTPVECKNVYISRNNSNDPFYAIVIPEMPVTGDSILTIDYIYRYDVDIDLDNVISKYNNCGFTAEELAAWLVHELYANIFTDITFTRYKKLLIHYYDVRNKAITTSHNNLGYMSWFGVFGNTKKDIITDSTSDAVSDNLRLYGLADNWNSALKKFIFATGGDWSIITNGYIEQADKACLEQFNKLARKYTAYCVKYANPDWKTLVKYLTTKVGSECLKNYVSKEPEHIAVIPEKDVNDIFDSRRLLRESYEAESLSIDLDASVPQTHENPLKIVKDYSKMTNADIFAEISELELDTQNVYTLSEKLLVAAKLKDFLRTLQDRIGDDPTNENLLSLKEKAYQLSNRLVATDVSEVSELEVG